MQTPDLTEGNIEKIKELFPNVVTEKEGDDGAIEKAVDFELLRQMLSKELVEDDNERYRLDWPGKKASLLKANTPITSTLRPDRESSVNFDTTENVFIEGDNFEVLKVLQESYLGKIKMIYIDPPYNTGKDFVYRDNRTVSKEDYEEELGVEDEEGGKLFRNTDTNGRFHSDWLSMMYERLVVARDLLKDDGVIFVSIDDNEVTNLKKICDEIFGEENFINTIIWQRASGGGNAKGIVTGHDYILVYQKDIKYIIDYKGDPIDKSRFSKDKIVKIDGEECFINDDVIRKVFGKYDEGVERRCYYEELSEYKNVKQIKEIEDKIKSKEYFLIKQSNGKHFIAEYIKSGTRKKMYSIIQGILNNQGPEDLINIGMNPLFFDYPKPVNLIKKIVSTVSEKDGFYLDFFAGSATTAHAILDLNAEDDGNRRFIMIQLQEETDKDSEAYKAGYKYISDIAMERIRLAAKKILKENKDKLKERETPFDIGFRVYKTDTTNMKDVYYHPSAVDQKDLFNQVSNIKEDRNPEDLLTQVILDLGLTLDLPIEKKKIKGNDVYFVSNNALIACFDDKIDFSIIDEIAKSEPLKVVFKDASFKEEQDRTNVETKFKRLSPDTIITVL